MVIRSLEQAFLRKCCPGCHLGPRSGWNSPPDLGPQSGTSRGPQHLCSPQTPSGPWGPRGPCVLVITGWPLRPRAAVPFCSVDEIGACWGGLGGREETPASRSLTLLQEAGVTEEACQWAGLLCKSKTGKENKKKLLGLRSVWPGSRW